MQRDQPLAIFVINLPGSTERRRSITGQLEQLGLDYRLVAGVDGDSLSPNDLTALTSSLPGIDPLQPKQVGCALGHQRVYSTMVEERIPAALVLEDDVALDPSLPDLLVRLRDELSPDELILLHWIPGSGCQITLTDARRLTGQARLCYPMTTTNIQSGAAYVLPHPVAERMVVAAMPVRHPADYWDCFREAGCFSRLRCVVPSPVEIRYELPSEIGLGRSHSRLVRAVLDFGFSQSIFPLPQLRVWNRRRIMRARQRDCSLVDYPSPMAAQHPGSEAEPEYRRG